MFMSLEALTSTGKPKFDKDKFMSWLKSVANIVPSTIEGDDDSQHYVSKFDGSYMGRVGMVLEDSILKSLFIRGITEQIQAKPESVKPHCTVATIGFSPTENKWYGWSHRAMYGFTVGSSVKKGDCAFTPRNKEEFKDDIINFWKSDCHEDTTAEEAEVNGHKGMNVVYKYNNKVKNEKLRGTISSVFNIYPDNWGRGEWTATTMDDAKQMALDFACGVSSLDEDLEGCEDRTDIVGSWESIKAIYNDYIQANIEGSLEGYTDKSTDKKYSHNSKLSDREPSWGTVNKTKLPNNAFADPKARKYPHHHIQNGEMFLHSKGLAAAWSAAMGARSGKKAEALITKHLRQHRSAIGVDKK